ncbi:MAG: hypothetical protein JXB36_08850 [Gammaproteobacteria bacterium]|nr:hypothetical protein [Gammaproteobacteria bacterium]
MHKSWSVRLPAALAATLALAGLGAASTSAVAQVDQSERIDGKPNLNGLWQAVNTAHWNLEAHSAEPLPDFWELGAIVAIPAGQSVVVGETIPYLPDALQRRNDNRESWPASDPEAKCYLPGIPRATYMPYPFQIIQGQKDILFAYEYASANRIVRMSEHEEPPVDSWMGWSNGHWDGDTLVIEVTGHNGQTWFDRAGNHHGNMLKVTERYTKMSDHILDYEATIEDPETFSRPWQIRMPLYRRVEPNAQLLEFKCVEFSEELLYGELTKKEQD